MYAGNYTIRAYRDYDDTVWAYGGSTTGYNSSYGNIPSITAENYAYTYAGPWDPPEVNATETKFTVTPGTLTCNVKSGNDTMYWNFPGEVNISIRDSSGDPVDSQDYTVKVYNKDDEPMTGLYFTGSGDDALITKYDGYCLINSSNWGVESGSTIGGNGTWYAYIYSDLNGDRTEGNKTWTEEWNGTAEWKVKKAPGVQFKWIDDDGTGTGNDYDGELSSIPAKENLPVNLYFQIIGSDGTYYGATSASEAMENITLSGNALFTGTLDKIPGVSFVSGNNTWKVPIIPTMSVGGGSVDIDVVWENYGSISESLSIGGTNYATNGTVVTITSGNDKFEIGNNQTFEIQVKDANGNPYPWANIYLYYIGENGKGTGDEGADQTPADDANDVVDHVIGGGTSDGKYTLGFNKTQQTDNQTSPCEFTNEMAPRNLTLYVSTQNAGYGYARIKMVPKSDLKITFEAGGEGTSTLLAGQEYSYFYINITKIDEDGNSTGTPFTTDYSQMTVNIYDADGNIVTTDIGSLSASDMSATSMGNDYKFKIKNEYITRSGEYRVYAHNYTSNTEGNNASLVVKQAHVECDKSPFIWMNDANISATFTVTSEIDDSLLNGTLIIDNMTWTDGTYNKTYCNTSYDGSSDQGGNDSVEVDDGEGFVNGKVTIHNITANFLPAGQSEMNITFWFKPEDGEWARASGRVPVQVPVVTPEPQYVAVSERTQVVVTVTGRDTPLDDIFVRIHGRGVDTNGTSGDNGKVTFTVEPTSTGNISIDVGEDGRTVDTKLYATAWELSVSVPAQVDEGDDFTVTVTEETSGDPVEGATVTVTGIGSGTTLADGTVDFTAPMITSDRTLTITATKGGYAPDTAKSITVVNRPMLFINAPKKGVKGESFTVEAGGDDGNNNGITVTIKDSSGTTVEEGTTVNGKVSFTIGEKGTYTISATKTDYEPATDVTIEIKEGTPGFELLTLIVALGVAFILIRRRRQ